MLIFVLAVLVAVTIADGSVKATRDSKEVTTATLLLQNIMVETETKIETEGLDKGCEKKREAKFEAPYERFTWVTYCNEIELNLSQTAAQLSKAEPDEKEAKEDALQKMILQTASDYIGKALREVHAEVSWAQGKTKRKVAATTHIVRYDLPLALPSLGVGGTN